MKFRTRLAALTAVLSLLATGLHGQVPHMISYEGRVSVGTLNFDGSGAFKFALVNATGATTYWSNDGTSAAGAEPNAAVTLAVTKGLFSVLLGDTSLANMTALPGAVFNNADVRLRVWFNDGTHGFQLLAPDRRIAAVGYAIMAGDVPNGAITGAKIAPGAVGATQLANGAVTSTHLANGAVGSAQLGSNLTIAGTITGTFSGNGAGLTNVSGTVQQATIRKIAFIGDSIMGDDRMNGTQAPSLLYAQSPYFGQMTASRFVGSGDTYPSTTYGLPRPGNQFQNFSYSGRRIGVSAPPLSTSGSAGGGTATPADGSAAKTVSVASGSNPVFTSTGDHHFFAGQVLTIGGLAGVGVVNTTAAYTVTSTPTPTTFTVNASPSALSLYSGQVRPMAPASARELVFGVVMLGTNDIHLAARTAPQVYADLQTEWQNLRADGFIVVAVTLLPRNDAYNPVITATNALIKSDPTKYDILVDAATTGGLANPADTAYYADGLHLTGTGSQILADAIHAGIKTWDQDAKIAADIVRHSSPVIQKGFVVSTSGQSAPPTAPLLGSGGVQATANFIQNTDGQPVLNLISRGMAEGSATPSLRLYTSADTSNFHDQYAGSLIVGVDAGGIAYSVKLDSIGDLNLTSGGRGAVILNGPTVFANSTIYLPKTMAQPGATTVQRIDKTSGSIRLAAGDTSKVLNNSLVGTTSVVMATVCTHDATCKSVQAVKGAGTITFYPNAAPTGEVEIDFIVTN